LRSASQRWPPKYTALNESKVGKKVNWKTGRVAEHYRCSECKGDFPAKDVQVDHIEPVINPTEGFTTWDEVIKRMFVEKGGYQTLCKQCHNKKTLVERQHAKEIKDAKRTK